MPWLNWLINRRTVRSASRTRQARPTFDALEERLVLSSADLIAYRPVTSNFNYANFRVAEIQEDSYANGAGIRMNGDDDNANGVADRADLAAQSVADNDLVRVDVVVLGTSTQLLFPASLQVWTSATKSSRILSGDPVSSGTVWVEYAATTHTQNESSAVLTLTASDETGGASDEIVFHSFRSVVIAIGGSGQDPATLTGSVFSVAYTLYQQGYDVHTYRHDQVSSSGAGAAMNEVVGAITQRDVVYVGVFGFSWGGGATYELARGMSNSAALQGKYTLSYTAYIDGITHGSISSERRLPTATKYHDNIYQRRDLLLRGNTVSGATNLNVNTMTWGKNLNHTSIDDSSNVHSIIVSGLSSRMVG